MPDTKISALTAITGANTASGDLLVIVDVSDTTMAASGTDKKITLAELELGITLDGLDVPVIASPVSPAAGYTRIIGRDIGGRLMLGSVGPAGLDTTYQPHYARNSVTSWLAAGGAGTTVSLERTAALTGTGTITAAAAFATTNIYTRMKKVEYLVTAAATTAVAGFRGPQLEWTRGNAADVGGFHFICRWGPATGVATTTNRAFVGMSNTATGTAPTDVEPSSLLSQVGMAWDAADTNIQIMHNDAAGTCTKVNLGASFPVPTSDRTKMYELDLFCVANGSDIKWRVTDLGTGSTTSGTITTDLPANNVALGPRAYMSVGGTSSVIGIALNSLYIETDY